MIYIVNVRFKLSELYLNLFGVTGNYICLIRNYVEIIAYYIYRRKNYFLRMTNYF